MDSDEGRNKGVRKDLGKIIKGTLTEAPTKLKASSIPSKIENVVFNNHHKAAFGNSQERFYTPTVSQLITTPGPGNYNPSILQGKIDSKKGMGFLASQTKNSRFNTKRNWNPGPGRYEITKPSLKKRSHSTAQLSSSIQARQLFKNEINALKNNPGPGNYEQRLFRSNSAAAPVFKSKFNRFSNAEKGTPGVGQYQWQVVKNKIKSLKFTSHTTATLLQQKSFHQKYYDKVMGNTQTDPTKELGPGKYNPAMNDTKRTFSIRNDERGRFADIKGIRQENIPPIESDRTPTITQMKKVNSHKSVFQSRYKRYEFGQIQSKFIGDPWKYSPDKNQRRSHLVNFSKKWV